MLLQVHDELVFEVYKKEIETVRSIIGRNMKEALPLSIPIEVDVGVGKTWLEAH
jgi:DNA polymerase-1